MSSYDVSMFFISIQKNRTSYLILFLLFFNLLLLSCSLTQGFRHDNRTPGSVSQRVFFGEASEVDNAIRSALKKYPVQIDNLENGIYETDYLKGDRMFRAPSNEPQRSNHTGLRYKINVQCIRGKVDGKQATRILLKKVLEKQRDFFADAEALPTDGVEENVILYRISRELSLSRAIKKSQQITP